MSHEQIPPHTVLSDAATKDVLTLRKIELLVDVLGAVEGANTPDAYGVKLRIINKLEDLVEEI